MKIISICKKCKGKGSIQSYGFLKKSCPVCKGKGKTIKRVTDLKNRTTTVISSPRTIHH